MLFIKLSIERCPAGALLASYNDLFRGYNELFDEAALSMLPLLFFPRNSHDSKHWNDTAGSGLVAF